MHLEGDTPNLVTELSAPTDQFSFGLVLYEITSGTHPFRRETSVQTIPTQERRRVDVGSDESERAGSLDYLTANLQSSLFQLLFKRVPAANAARP